MAQLITKEIKLLISMAFQCHSAAVSLERFWQLMELRHRRLNRRQSPSLQWIRLCTPDARTFLNASIA
jgi:hypothetical protein